MNTAVKVKDFIIDLDKEVKIANKNKIEYTLLLENDMDFVINRKSSKSNKDLVFLVSQDLYYIKDNKTEIITKLTKDNIKIQLSTFSRDMEKWIKFSKVSWTENSNTDRLYDLFISKNRKLFLKHGIVKYDTYRATEIADLLEQSPKLIKYCNSKIGLENYKLIDAIYYIMESTDYNNAKLFIDIIEDLNLKETYSGYLIEILTLMKYYKFDTNTFLKYITYGFYSQGILGYDNNIYINYKDYLNMSNSMYGKIKNKYPKALKTEHDKLSLKYNLYTEYKNDLTLFNVSKEYQDLKYKDSKYSIIIPETSADIIEEGVNQSNCVASYVEKVVEGKTLIVFMRDNNNLEESLVTIEVKEGVVCQVKAYANTNTTAEQDKFISKWAKVKELKVNYK